MFYFGFSDNPSIDFVFFIEILALCTPLNERESASLSGFLMLKSGQSVTFLFDWASVFHGYIV